MTNENDKTIDRANPIVNNGVSQDGFDPAASFDAATIAQADLGVTIKQAVLPLLGVDLNATIARPAPVPAFDDSATIARSAPNMTNDPTPPPQDDVTIAAAHQHETQGGATNTEAFKDTLFKGTVPNIRTNNNQSDSRSGQSSHAGVTGQSQSLSGSGRSHSVSLRMGDSSVSINIHPRNITKSIGGEHIKYDATAGAPDMATDFELLEQLGEGGMGVVYAARQSSIDRPIALKMIKGSALTSAAARSKFLQEAVVTGDLDHPNIVTVHDLGADAGGNVFYAMKKISGTEWSKAIKQRSQRENLDILLNVCDAVAFAHSRGVIHRDLKPENVMLGSFGEVLVMDWGLAVAVNNRGKAERISANTGISGTPAYLAPEMTTPGRWREVGFCSDLYLLGAILYEILTGHRPHTGRNVGECLRNAARNVIRESSVTGELMEIARTAMAAKPIDRYATVQDFQAAIREYLSHSESVLLEQKARENLSAARESRQHEDFARALFGFRQAHEMWDGNRQALAGLVETVLLYATVAMQSGDLDLASSLVSRDNFPECAQLSAAIANALKVREQQRRRNRRLRIGVIALSAAVLLIAVGAAVLINKAKVRAEAALQAEQAARIAEKAAQEQEKRERLQKQAAQAEAKESKAVIQKRDELAANTWWAFTTAAPQRQQEAAQAQGLPPTRSIDLGKGTELKLALIPAGSFAMGSTLDENGRLSEENLHRVQITKPFYLAQYELTIDQYKALGGIVEAPVADPAQKAAANHPGSLPVAGLSWNDLQEKLLPELNKHAPKGWRFVLPTEAQWEWACRAGSNTAFYTGNDEAALRKAGFSGSENLTGVAPVGKRAPNAWGLYDMHGNLAEWCADYYQKDFYPMGVEISVDPVAGDNKLNKRVVRGGSWSNLDVHCRSAYRSYANPGSRYQFIGVRLALVQQ